MSSHDNGAKQPIRVLLVEDDEDDYVLTRQMLSEIRNRQYEIEWVADYDAAISAACQGRHDVCLLDYQLGGHTGLELVRRVVELGCRMPIILLTGRDDHDVDIEVMSAGATDFLVKDQVSSPLLERAIRYSIERKRTEQILADRAYIDDLTGLANRALFGNKLVEALANADRTQLLVALIYLDLDHFKDINDTLGHIAGDLLLKQVAQRLRKCGRDTDTVARMGGDEFAIVAVNVKHDYDASILAKRILEVLSEPFDLDGHKVYTGASIGVTVYPSDDGDAGRLLMNADLALYRAKATGRNTFQYFDAEMNAQVQNRRALEIDLRHAIERQELHLQYQPQVDLAMGRVLAVEALIRWNHAERGLVTPNEFIPIAEATGLIVPIGELVLRLACQQCRAWQRSISPYLRMAVNLSPVQFHRSDFVQTVTTVLEETGLDPQFLELEITESTIMRNVDKAIATLRELSELGIQLAVDDFGTGYSSFNYLKQFPLRRLKIDQSFVQNLQSNADDRAIVEAIIKLGHSLHLTVIAEGVELYEQLDYLRQSGCDEGQGYYFSRPMTVEDATNWLAEHRPVALDKAG